METLQRILHVEDDESIRKITKVTLETLGGFEVLGCESGFDALEQFESFQPQMILLDVMMPGMDGPTTLARLRENHNLDGIPVIFMTAKVQDKELDHYHSLGANDVIIKPFDPGALVSQVNDCWESFHQS